MTTATKKRAARAIADVTQGTILATVDIAATPERVFRALTSPEEVTRWWGSEETYRTTGWTMDLRVGGKWRADGRGSDGSPFSVEGEFLEIDPPHKLVQTWKPAWDGGHATTLTYRLEPIAEGTRVTVRHEGFAGRPESCRTHAEGWESVLGWLDGHAGSEGASAPSRFFVCRLLPPRPTFVMDMSAEERAVMQEHVAYWTGHLRAGTAIVFGPVADPSGPWGLGVVRVADEAAVRALEAGDPAIRSERGFRYEVLPMLQAVTRG
ncbi:SRPBCC domain-containing protein [Sorangium sp. So ce1153]|uniref:SRPBCC domain-containing protein n=1 Tax=Sorangium sp. So ce1153 TaxID=3133333 RepID=UPI003F616424